MHPAPSVIAFTTLSGAGFGLLVWIGLGLITPTGWAAFGFFALAYALAAGGLMASTFHLGHPERALLAFTQWRTSWLSREGWASVAALMVMAVYGAGLVFFSSAWPAFGWIGAALSLVTIGTTSMIYAQLRTVPRWRHWTTPAMFFATGLAGGALLTGQAAVTLPLLALAGIVQVVAWVTGDGRMAASGTDIATATGLGGIGKVRSFEPPHTGTNYLLKEMVYEVGRRRSGQLRVLGLGLGYGIPILMLLLPQSVVLTAIAALGHIVGVAATRWLFFAEAEHVVGLYYGKRAA